MSIFSGAYHKEILDFLNKNFLPPIKRDLELYRWECHRVDESISREYGFPVLSYYVAYHGPSRSNSRARATLDNPDFSTVSRFFTEGPFAKFGFKAMRGTGCYCTTQQDFLKLLKHDRSSLLAAIAEAKDSPAVGVSAQEQIKTASDTNAVTIEAVRKCLAQNFPGVEFQITELPKLDEKAGNKTVPVTRATPNGDNGGDPKSSVEVMTQQGFGVSFAPARTDTATTTAVPPQGMVSPPVSTKTPVYTQ